MLSAQTFDAIIHGRRTISPLLYVVMIFTVCLVIQCLKDRAAWLSVLMVWDRNRRTNESRRGMLKVGYRGTATMSYSSDPTSTIH
jgi:hypothetical protein